MRLETGSVSEDVLHRTLKQPPNPEVGREIGEAMKACTHSHEMWIRGHQKMMREALRQRVTVLKQGGVLGTDSL